MSPRFAQFPSPHMELRGDKLRHQIKPNSVVQTKRTCNYIFLTSSRFEVMSETKFVVVVYVFLAYYPQLNHTLSIMANYLYFH